MRYTILQMLLLPFLIKVKIGDRNCFSYKSKGRFKFQITLKKDADYSIVIHELAHYVYSISNDIMFNTATEEVVVRTVSEMFARTTKRDLITLLSLKGDCYKQAVSDFEEVRDIYVSMGQISRHETKVYEMIVDDSIEEILTHPLFRVLAKIKTI